MLGHMWFVICVCRIFTSEALCVACTRFCVIHIHVWQHRLPWLFANTDLSFSLRLIAIPGSLRHTIHPWIYAHRLPWLFALYRPSMVIKKAGLINTRSTFYTEKAVNAYSILSRAFWKRLACERSAFASVSNQSAISSKPSSRADFAIPGYISVYS